MYKLKSIVRFSEVNTRTQLRLDALIDYFQDVAVAESEAHYGGLTYLATLGLAWVVNFWQIDIERLPKLGENITAITFPYSYRHFLGLRNNAMWDGEGKTIVKSWSVWSMINLEEGKPARLPQKILDNDPVSPRLDMEYTERKIDLPEKQGAARPEILVTPTMLDENGHLNNAHFVRIALDLLPHEKAVKRLRVEYRKQVFLGDQIFPLLYSCAGQEDSRQSSGHGDKDSGKDLVVLNNQKGENCCLVELTYE